MADVDRLDKAEQNISLLQRSVDDLALCIQQVSTGMAFLVARIAQKEGQASSSELAGDASRQLCQLQQLLAIYQQKYPEKSDSSMTGQWPQLLMPAGRN